MLLDLCTINLGIGQSSIDAGVPLCSEYCLLVEIEEDVLVRGLRFWLHARVPGVRSYVEVVVNVFRHHEVAMLLIFS